MKSINNVIYSTQYLTIFFILDLQENIYKQVKKTYYMSAGEVVGLGDLSIDVFLEEIRHIVKISRLQRYRELAFEVTLEVRNTGLVSI